MLLLDYLFLSNKRWASTAEIVIANKILEFSSQYFSSQKLALLSHFVSKHVDVYGEAREHMMQLLKTTNNTTSAAASYSGKHSIYYIHIW